MAYFLFTLIGCCFLFANPLIAILFFILSLQPLFRLMERRGQPFSHKAYLLLCLVFIGTGLFSISMLGMVYIGMGILHIFFAINTWLSYQQMKIDQREDNEE
ncbi:hypothetical protein MK805_16415 [Shimazuella sp. AN120528]|uniref:hypothetical protein n=1 Tax=Shimazuella soli TaxID=1892854 RepID=UPI001F0CE90A|nr:hypothetical protein [Shimazuella soli]MCH5586525.1 hypothetical protein [Shimazuella soli]